MLPRDVRPSSAVARVVLITALASVAVPGIVGAWTPHGSDTLDPAAFRPVTVRPGASMAALDLARANRSNARLDPQDALVEPPGAVAPSIDRPAPDQPDPTALVVAIATPTPVRTPRPASVVTATLPSTTSVSGSWIYDHEVSWYGPGFYGQRTACGLTLTTDLIGVAHRTLPCGTIVTFRNPANGVVVSAPVVDRGPYVSGRQWDLTGGLCVALDHCYTGPLYYRIL